MNCGIKDENNDICGETFTCGACRVANERDVHLSALNARNQELSEIKNRLDLLQMERREVGDCCTRFENSWKACQMELDRIHPILEKLAEARHGTRQDDADLLCDSIDSALTAIWGKRRLMFDLMPKEIK